VTSEATAAGSRMIVLLVVVPLASAIVTFVAGRRAVPAVPFTAALVQLAAAVGLALQVEAAGPVRHAIGGWDAPLGIVLHADGLSVVLLLLVAVVGAGVTVVASRPGETPDGALGFWPLWLALQGALNALLLSADLFNLYVTLELSTLAAIPLIALGGGTGALAAAIRYLMLAVLGSLLYLGGVALHYAAVGTLDLVVAGVSPPAALALMVTGLLVKAALVPLHAWLPPAHAAAPAPVSAALSALVVKAPLYVIIRLWSTTMSASDQAATGQVLGVLGAIAVLWGSVQALRQDRLKLLVAYSTVAQVGYFFLLFPLLGAGGAPWAPMAWGGALLLIVSHGLAKAAMFIAAGGVSEAFGHDRLASLTGAAERSPVATFALGLSGVSIMGLPPSGGFTGKWLLLQASVGSGQWWWGAVLIVGSLLAAGYVFRVLRVALTRPDADVAPATRRAATRAEAGAVVLATLALLLGLAATRPLDLLMVGAPDAVLTPVAGQ
jgi:multicomponent Na+:H+ antiporter subunit D